MSGAFLTDANDSKRSWVLTAEENQAFVIGREMPAELVLALAPISRKHAAIVFRDGRHWLSDLGSRNGTYVNGSPVGNEQVRLIDGDEIVVGGAHALCFHDPTQTVKGERIGRLTGIWINERNGDVFADSQRVVPPLSAAQMTLLTLLYTAKGRVVSREEIVASVWPADEPKGISEEAIDGLIKRLRARLRTVNPDVEYIELVRGRGVRIKQQDGSGLPSAVSLQNHEN